MSSQQEKSVRVSLRGPIMVIEIYRPHKRNAIDRHTAELLADAFRKFEADNDAKCAVLCGSNGNFCAGADLRQVDNRMEDDGDAPMGISRMVLRKPLICAISGFAVAGGLELSLLADIRICEEDSIFGVFCRRFGVPLIDGGTVRLPRIVGRGPAMYMILTGKPINATEALRIGLVSEIVPRGSARRRAEQIALELSNMPQKCMLSDRQSAYEQENLNFSEAMKNEFRLGKQIVLSPEFREGPAKFTQGEGRHGEFESKL